jgi:hypothetical protein
VAVRADGDLMKLVAAAALEERTNVKVVPAVSGR